MPTQLVGHSQGLLGGVSDGVQIPHYAPGRRIGVNANRRLCVAGDCQNFCVNAWS
jgi:hypothetical protein